MADWQFRLRVVVGCDPIENMGVAWMTSNDLNGTMDPPVVLVSLLTGCIGHVATAFGRLDRTAALTALREAEVFGIKAIVQTWSRRLDDASAQRLVAMFRDEIGKAVAAVERYNTAA
jgi:hypothetical protein